MKQIPLTKGKFAIVDDEDYPYLSRFKWSVGMTKEDRFERVVTYMGSHNGQSVRVDMTKFLIEDSQSSQAVYFKNRNHLDFRKENLIVGGEGSRCHNGRKYVLKDREPTSKYKGVKLTKKKRDDGTFWTRWVAMISKDNVKYYLGGFGTEAEAAEAYNEKARELYGDLAYQNKINDNKD